LGSYLTWIYRNEILILQIKTNRLRFLTLHLNFVFVVRDVSIYIWIFVICTSNKSTTACNLNMCSKIVLIYVHTQDLQQLISTNPWNVPHKSFQSLKFLGATKLWERLLIPLHKLVVHQCITKSLGQLMPSKIRTAPW